MDVLITRYIGIIGTAILAREYSKELNGRYPSWLVNEACQFDSELDTYDDKEIISSLNEDVVYASEYTEFGVFEALFQAAKELKCGLRINIKSIPIKQETVEVTECVGVNPYALYSGLSEVIICNNGLKVQQILENKGISSQIVGTTANDNDKIIINDEESGFLPHIRKDELKNKLGRRLYYERTNTFNTREE